MWLQVSTISRIAIRTDPSERCGPIADELFLDFDPILPQWPDGVVPDDEDVGAESPAARIAPRQGDANHARGSHFPELSKVNKDAHRQLRGSPDNS